MNAQEFIEKMESEGPAYAFTEYGLSADDLDADVSPEFRNAVKGASAKFQDANAFVERIYTLGGES